MPEYLTAAAYWQEKQRAGWFYALNPQHQWRGTQRLSGYARMLAPDCHPSHVQWETDPIRYSPYILDAAWALMVEHQIVLLWNEVPDTALPY